MELNVSEIILEGLTYTVMGVCVVFIVLLIIMCVIKAMALFSSEKTEEVKKTEPAPESVPTASVPEKTADDTELIAVITAAIAASLGTSSSGLVIRSYKKVSGGAWNKQGRREVLDNRF